MANYFPLFALTLLAVLFIAGSLLVSKLLGPRHRPTAAKMAPYECGVETIEDPPRRFPVRFYLVAMIFIIFDIEVVFLYPWAVIFRGLGTFGLVEVGVFGVVVFAALLYMVSNGALDWAPAKRLMRSSTVERTTRSTVSRSSSLPRGSSEVA
jgi:NADH-quinone oxidoreductase subunit A